MRTFARSIAAAGVAGALAASAACSGGSGGGTIVPGTNTSAAQVAALKAGQSIAVNGILRSLTFRRTCVQDAATTVCASLIPPGPRNPLLKLPPLNLSALVSGVVVRGKFGDPHSLTWTSLSS